VALEPFAFAVDAFSPVVTELELSCIPPSSSGRTPGTRAVYRARALAVRSGDTDSIRLSQRASPEVCNRQPSSSCTKKIWLLTGGFPEFVLGTRTPDLVCGRLNGCCWVWLGALAEALLFTLSLVSLPVLALFSTCCVALDPECWCDRSDCLGCGCNLAWGGLRLFGLGDGCLPSPYCLVHALVPGRWGWSSLGSTVFFDLPLTFSYVFSWTFFCCFSEALLRGRWGRSGSPAVLFLAFFSTLSCCLAQALVRGRYVCSGSVSVF